MVNGVRFHFLNVGGGDCTIVHFPERVVRSTGRKKNERIMMVDIHHHEDHENYEDVAAYYKANFQNPDGTYKPIWRFVFTHPHQDHISGIKAFFETEGIKIINIWDVTHTFVPDNFDGHPTHEDDWKHYKEYTGKNSPVTVLRLTRETEPKEFWNDDEDRITILNPCAATIQHANFKEDGTARDPKDVEIDEVSYALSIRVNDRGVILGGDGRCSPVWDNIFEHCKEDLKRCRVLKAAHHGHESGFHEKAVKLMAPACIVFSNGAAEDEENGAESLYKAAVPTAAILKTHELGTIVVTVPFDAAERISYNHNG